MLCFCEISHNKNCLFWTTHQIHFQNLPRIINCFTYRLWFPWTSQLFLVQNCEVAVCVGDHPNEDFERKIEKVYLFCAKYVGDMLELLSKYGELKEKKSSNHIWSWEYCRNKICISMETMHSNSGLATCEASSWDPDPLLNLQKRFYKIVQCLHSSWLKLLIF